MHLVRHTSAHSLCFPTLFRFTTHNTEFAFVYPKNGIWPKSASKLTNLYKVETNAIPDFIGSWKKLEILKIFHSTGFTSIPPELPGSLKELQLAYAFNVTAIPASILRLTSLNKLRLQGNDITSIPAGIERMTSLEEVVLQHNKITSIPASLGTLTSLKTLLLMYNDVESLGPFAKGAACPGNEKKEGSKHTIVKLAGNYGVCKSNVTLNGTTYLDGYDSNEVRLHFINLCSNSKIRLPTARCSTS